MKRAETRPTTGKAAKAAPATKEPLQGDGFDPPETEEDEDPDAPDELADETGLDLTDASDLDADNVTADEEFDRVMQAPD